MILSEQDLQRLGQRFNARHHSGRKDRYFTLAVGDQDTDTWVQVLLQNEYDSFHYPVEARIAKSKAKHPRAQVFFLLAFIDAYWEEFFAEGENVFFPIDWTLYKYQEEEFYVRGQVLNRLAENMADEFLHKHGY